VTAQTYVRRLTDQDKVTVEKVPKLELENLDEVLEFAKRWNCRVILDTRDGTTKVHVQYENLSYAHIYEQWSDVWTDYYIVKNCYGTVTVVSAKQFEASYDKLSLE
jgi:hypothetical protein